VGPPRNASAIPWLLGALLLQSSLPASAAASQAGPEAAVQRLQQGLLELDRSAPDASPAQRYPRLDPLIRSTHDLDYMARLALGPEWELLDQAQRAQFTDLFARLGIASYAERFRGLAGERFSATSERELRGGRVEVRSALQSADGSSVAFVYVLHQPPGQGWRIINILAEGVSELALQRAEYRRVLADRGWDGLLQHMRDKSDLVDS
jgi:phospholipid transport system substrate-binding protein